MSLEILFFAILGILVGYIVSRRLFAHDYSQVLAATLLGGMLVAMAAMIREPYLAKFLIALFVINSYLIIVLKLKGRFIRNPLMITYLVNILILSFYMHMSLSQIIIMPIITTILAFGLKISGKIFAIDKLIESEDIKLLALAGFVLPIELLPGFLVMLSIYSLGFALLLRISKQIRLFSLSIPIVFTLYCTVVMPNTVGVFLSFLPGVSDESEPK